MVAIDPHTGRVLALSGGFSFELSQFNRATQAKRQPGSSIKPFVYLTALENGFTPSTLVDDSPVSISQGPGMPPWTPANYSSNSFRGPTPLRVALEKSLNTVTARLAAALGMEAIGQTVEKFGIMDRMPRFYAMALGAGETTPLRHTAAYAMLANGGRRITPTLIDRIQDRYGKTIFRADRRRMRGLRRDRMEEPAGPDDPRQPRADRRSGRDIPAHDDARRRRTRAAPAPRSRPSASPFAGKTGTTNDWQDAWFVGFTPDLAAGVFVGYDEPSNLGSDETGGHLAAPIFRDFMIAALKDAPAKEFRTPAGLADVPGQPGDRIAGRSRRAGDLGGLQARHRARPRPDAGIAPARRSDRRRRRATPLPRRRWRRARPLPARRASRASRPRPPTRRPAAPAGFIENARLSPEGRHPLFRRSHRRQMERDLAGPYPGLKENLADAR